MLEPGFIAALTDEVVKAIKEDERNPKDKRGYPAFNPIYRESVTLDEEVAVHSELKAFPSKLFKSKAPNESDAERKYREESYQPETLPLWNRALANTNRILNEQNYSIKWDEENEKDETRPSLYFEKDYPLYGSFITAYVDSVIRPRKINSPNSLLCFKPRDLPFSPTEEEGMNGRDYSFDDTQLIEPVGVIYKPEQVLRYRPGEYAFIRLNEFSWVDTGKKNKEKVGLVFELYDKDAIYRIEQVGKQTDWLFETYLYYQHDWNKLPCSKLKGQPIDRDGDLLYKSYFYDAVPPLNQALYDSSTLQVSKVANVFLEKWEYAAVCDNTECNDGKIKIYGDGDSYKEATCSSCKGTGWKRNGVLGVYQLRMPDRMNPAEPQTPPAGYIQKNTEVLTFLREEIKYNERKSFLFMGVDVSDSDVKGSDTALGKMIDREALFSALKVIASELFDLIEFGISAIGYMRYGKEFKQPHINRPTTFSIRTYQDLTIEISEAIKAGLPEVALRTLIDEYLKTRFSSNAEKTMIADLVAAADDLQMMPTADIATRLGQGTIAKWQDVLHVNIYRFIDELSQDKDWMNRDMNLKVADLQAKAQGMATEIQPKANSPESIYAGL